MKTYEAMFIFPSQTDDAHLEEKMEKARAEIVKLGGTVTHTTRMGRAAFARRMRKKDAGVYVLTTFALDGAKLAALHERYRLNEDLLRVQIVVAPPAPPPKPAAAPAAAVAG